MIIYGYRHTHNSFCEVLLLVVLQFVILKTAITSLCQLIQIIVSVVYEFCDLCLSWIFSILYDSFCHIWI